MYVLLSYVLVAHHVLLLSTSIDVHVSYVFKVLSQAQLADLSARPQSGYLKGNTQGFPAKFPPVVRQGNGVL